MEPLVATFRVGIQDSLSLALSFRFSRWTRGGGRRSGWCFCCFLLKADEFGKRRWDCPLCKAAMVLSLKQRMESSGGVGARENTPSSLF